MDALAFVRRGRKSGVIASAAGRPGGCSVSGQVPRPRVSALSKPAVILIAEDDEDNREGYAEYLSFLGYRVEQASDGDSAWTRTQELCPDVLLLDLALPGTDGWEVARRVRANPRTRGMLVIALSACVFPDDVLRARDAGCDLFLDKPCYPEAVADAIARLLASRANAGARLAVTPPTAS
jgi:two-component system, cell cycle response regulator DivK